MKYIITFVMLVMTVPIYHLTKPSLGTINAVSVHEQLTENDCWLHYKEGVKYYVTLKGTDLCQQIAHGGEF